MDLVLPVQRQMDVILANKLPATWLLQFDALVDGPWVGILKSRMPRDHEVGFWFEMNQKLCNAAQVEWRGRPGYEWDHLPPVAFTIGYTPEERIKLADAAMAEFRRQFGTTPKSVASWNLDSITIGHLSERYGVQAYAVCRDQIATDGFTIWGAPIAGYYPSKVNCWSPALEPANQIKTPIFRMLGQDPVYYYQNHYPIPGEGVVGAPDTMEPVWKAGRSEKFVQEFLKMIAEGPSLDFAYAQLGQENSFGWPSMTPGYEMQMKALAALHGNGDLHVETMGESGRRFQRAFRVTPPQAQVMLEDPFGNTDPAEKTVWYQSRYYRANLHIRGNQFWLRDITVYSDRFEQPFLRTATRLNEVEQRMPAVLDGYHWSRKPRATDAGGFFSSQDRPLLLTREPRVSETGSTMTVELPVGADVLTVRFTERGIEFSYPGSLAIDFNWDAAKSSFVRLDGAKANYRWHDFEYATTVSGAQLRSIESGWGMTAQSGKCRLALDQPR
jgi:hypothetical protein